MWALRRDLAVETIRNAAPDIIGRQETLAGQLTDLVTGLPDYEAIGEGRRGGHRDEHCAILYRTQRFTSKEIGVADAGMVIDSSRDRYPSDHFPVTSSLRLPATPLVDR